MASADQISSAFIAESRHLLLQAMRKIRHCLGQLSQDQIWQRPFDGQNSIGNLLLHLRGNLQQWVVDSLDGQDNDRDRAAEFSEDGPVPVADLLASLEATINDAMYTMSHLASGELLSDREVQGFHVTSLGAIIHSVTHFVGHTHQIVYATRAILKDDYKFEWSPGPARDRVPI